ncbi:hypothetical protein BJY01DRAFT_220373, partial [Aspergillus pseudoustus]
MFSYLLSFISQRVPDTTGCLVENHPMALCKRRTWNSSTLIKTGIMFLELPLKFRVFHFLPIGLRISLGCEICLYQLFL